MPGAGEPAVFCRPVVTAPAVVRRDGTVLADAWLPDLVRLGELEAHLGDGVIEAVVDAAIAAGRLKPRQRRRIMSYPLVIRLMIAMILAYLAMMAFVIYSARHPAPATIASITFSPAMIALASCMAFSVILTGLFVFMRHGD